MHAISIASPNYFAAPSKVTPVPLLSLCCCWLGPKPRPSGNSSGSDSGSDGRHLPCHWLLEGGKRHFPLHCATSRTSPITSVHRFYKVPRNCKSWLTKEDTERKKNEYVHHMLEWPSIILKSIVCPQPKLLVLPWLGGCASCRQTCSHHHR